MPRVAVPRAVDVRPDRDLLAAGDVGELVRRHAGMVRRAAADVCPHAADDVTQAAFVLLARKAAALADRESAAGWLFQTARRLALKARTAAVRRAKYEARAAAPRVADATPLDELSFREVRAAVGEELARLPDDLQTPLLLHYWEGASHAAAAARLGCSVSTLKRRLDDARDRLAARLARRGFAGAAVLAALVGMRATAFAPPPGLSPLAAELLRTSAAGKLVAVVLLSSLVLGPWSLVRSTGPEPPAADAGPTKDQGPGTKDDPDPLPPGAVARLGSARFQHGKNLRHIAESNDGKLIVTRDADNRHQLWDAASGRRLPLPATDKEAVQYVGPAGDRVIALVRATDVVGKLQVRAVPGGEAVGELPHDPTAGGTEPIAVSANGRLVAFSDRSAPAAGPRPMWELVVVPLAGGPATVLERRADDFAGLVKLSADGTTLLAQWSKLDIQVWDVPNKRLLLSLPRHAGNYVESLALSGDGKTVVRFVPGERRVRVWDVPTGKEKPLLRGQPANEYERVAVSADGSRVAGTATADKLPVIRVWDTATGRQVTEFPAAFGGVQEMIFARDGKRLLTVTGDMVGIYDLATGKPVGDRGGHTYTVWRLAWSPDGSRLATASIYTDPAVRVWDTATGRLVGTVAGGDRGPAWAIAFSPDGRRLATACQDRFLYLWDAATLRPVAHADSGDEYPNGLAYAADGRTLLLGARERPAVRAWDAGTLAELPDRPLGSDGVTGWLRPEPDGGVTALHVRGNTPAALVTFAADGRERRRIPIAGLPQGTTCFTADTRRAVVMDEEKESAKLIEVATGRVLGEFRVTKPFKPMDAAFSPDERTVAIACRGGGVLVFETATLLERQRFVGHVGDVVRVAFGPDGRRLASTGGDTTAMIWDATTARTFTPTPPVTIASAAAAWDALADRDAVAGFAAVRYFAARPAELGGRLSPVAAVDAAKVNDWLAALDAPRFADRQAAFDSLAKHADAAAGRLRETLASTKSAEVRARLEKLLADADDAKLSGERLRAVRAVEALEAGGAKDALAKLAGGAADARLTREAAAAIKRMR